MLAQSKRLEIDHYDGDSLIAYTNKHIVLVDQVNRTIEEVNHASSADAMEGAS